MNCAPAASLCATMNSVGAVGPAISSAMAALLDGRLAASPLYVAVSVCRPMDRLGVQLAVRVVPLPIRLRPVQPATVLAPSCTLTVPVGLLPVTLTLSVMGLPEIATVAE